MATSQQVPRYHVAPNFSIPPPEAGGILELGSIISSVSAADEPLNEDCHIRIPQAKLFCSHQKGFTTTLSHLKSGEYGIWAKFIGIDGIGGELSWAAERSTEDIYHFRSIDTIYFNPSQEYLESSMKQSDVKDYVIGSGYDPVYMVTGLKTVRGPSVKMSKGRKSGFVAEIGVQSGLPIELGPKFNASKEARNEMGFQDSSDFIFGIRVKKLMYKKHWLTRATGALIAREHDKGATMVDDDSPRRNDDEVVVLEDDGIEAETDPSHGDDRLQETVWMARQE